MTTLDSVVIGLLSLLPSEHSAAVADLVICGMGIYTAVAWGKVPRRYHIILIGLAFTREFTRLKSHR